jgi:predicted nucleic acid-binding OB-fold protein
MSGLVDYRKRSVSLAPGCKDLMDVLSRRRERRFHEFAELAKALRVSPEEARELVFCEVAELKRVLTEAEKR